METSNHTPMAGVHSSGNCRHGNEYGLARVFILDESTLVKEWQDSGLSALATPGTRQSVQKPFTEPINDHRKDQV